MNHNELADRIEALKKKQCSNCRWWDMNSIGSSLGTCRHKINDTPMRAIHGKFSDNCNFKMHSFGYQEVRDSYSCSFFDAPPTDEVASLRAEGGE